MTLFCLCILQPNSFDTSRTFLLENYPTREYKFKSVKDKKYAQKVGG